MVYIIYIGDTEMTNTIDMVKNSLVEMKQAMARAIMVTRTIKPETSRLNNLRYWQAVNDVRALQSQISAFTSVWGE